MKERGYKEEEGGFEKGGEKKGRGEVGFIFGENQTLHEGNGEK